MVEFKTEYYTPMDRGYHESVEFDPVRPTANLEEPIMPIAQIGQTVPEHDPSGRFKNILQNVQAAIRGGTGSLQIVFQTPIESAIGGRPKAYGEEVRQAIKEVAAANEVLVTGMEMPTSLTNLSGWDPQHGMVNEEKRQRDLDEVKEMIRFAAEVGQGGGVDIVSWEHNRPAFRQDWYKEDEVAKKAFKMMREQEERFEEVRFVDKRSGQIVPIPIREGIWVFKDPKNFNDLDPFKEKPLQWKYDDFQRYAERLIKEGPEEKTSDFIKEMLKEGAPQTQVIYGLIKDHFIETQRGIAQAEAGYYRQRLRGTEQELKLYEEALRTGKHWREDRPLAPKERQEIAAEIPILKDIKVREIEGIKSQERVAAEHMARLENWQRMEDYTTDLSKKSYAEAGISAMQLQDKMGPKNIKKDLYVGPEIGWPQFYGSHPKEFVDMIRGARQDMVEILTDKQKCRQFGLDRPMGTSEAKEEAKRHIKGMFDTAHMGMWLQTFHPELPWDERKKKFDKWYKEQVEWLAEVNKKEDVIGAIQAVDSAGAAHGHLPAGQGILPVKDAIDILRKKGGFNGYVASEGHEEEKFGEGRILLKTWQHFNAPISSGYGPSVPVKRWGEVMHGYFGRTYSPLFMFGAYAPSNEFKLWSEVPLE